MSIFIFQPHSIIDIITNSSSELFVFKQKNINIIKKMLKKVYPNYLEEYIELRNIDELTSEELDTFMSCHCHSHQWPAKKEDYPLIGDYSFDELYEPSLDVNGQIERAWNGEIQYELKDNTKSKYNTTKLSKIISDELPNQDICPNESTERFKNKYRWPRFVIDENMEVVKNRIDPERKMYFLYSKRDNPNWEYQEKLMDISTRYHLG